MINEQITELSVLIALGECMSPRDDGKYYFNNYQIDINKYKERLQALIGEFLTPYIVETPE